MQQEESSQSSESMDMEPIDILPAMNGEIPGSSDVANVPVITVDPLGAPLVATTASVPMATGVLTGPNSVPMVTSVLTGPNTMGMIPTIVNLDFYTKQDPTWLKLCHHFYYHTRFVAMYILA